MPPLPSIVDARWVDRRSTEGGSTRSPCEQVKMERSQDDHSRQDISYGRLTNTLDAHTRWSKSRSHLSLNVNTSSDSSVRTSVVGDPVPSSVWKSVALIVANGMSTVCEMIESDQRQPAR